MNEPGTMGYSMGYFLQWSEFAWVWVLSIPPMESHGHSGQRLCYPGLPLLDQDDVDEAKAWAEEQLVAKGRTVTGWRRDVHGRLIPEIAARQQKRFASAQEWAEAMNAEMARTGMGAGALMSCGLRPAVGHILGVGLDREHPDADDKRGVVASASGWVVAWDYQHHRWAPR